jgi:hypothetical protein
VDRHELAWAAGFFDGEGWAASTRMGRGDKRRPMARINQADPSGVPEVLVRFQRALGDLGRIGGPYRKEARKDLYRWVVSSRHDVELLHHLLLPWLGQVKLDEFAAAIGRTPARARGVTSSDEWLAWCAGLFDGEGWVTLYPHRSHVGYLSPELGVGQSSASGLPAVLSRFQSRVGCGRIYGPYEQEGATMSVYRFKTYPPADIESVVAKIRPWLGAVKRGDADLVLEILRAQPVLPRGNPEWDNRKTHCIRGHEYASSRLRPYVSRGKNEPPRDSHQCLVCAREQAKARRDQKRRSAADDDRRSLSEFATIYLLK